MEVEIQSMVILRRFREVNFLCYATLEELGSYEKLADTHPRVEPIENLRLIKVWILGERAVEQWGIGRCSMQMGTPHEVVAIGGEQAFWHIFRGWPTGKVAWCSAT
jgi:hypothetical protein